MPIPLIVAAGAAAVAGTAFGLGRFSKKGEIEELKNKIIELQEQITKLTNIIRSQNDTIKKLKAENKSLNALHFFEKRKLSGQTRGMLVFQYSLAEYLEYIKLESEGKIMVQDPEHIIYDILDRLFHGKEVKLEEKGLIKLHIEKKYSYELKNLISLAEDDLKTILEVRRVG